MLTQQYIRTLLSYDPLTGYLTWKPRPISMFTNERACKSWNTRYAGKRAFTAIDAKGYLVGGIHDRTYRASRIIFILLYGYNPYQVDHVDGNRTNNTKLNLREVLGPDNQRNMKLSKNNTSGTTGVCWNTSKQAWDVHIGDKGKAVFLGRFTDKQAAIDCRKAAQIAYNYHPNHGRK